MKQKFFLLICLIAALSGCNFIQNDENLDQTPPTKAVVVVTKAPTATNFPKIGTPTPQPPTPTPAPTFTPTPYVSGAMFDDETLAELMAGTIASAGIKAEVEIVDERPNGGDRAAHITVISNYEIDESELLLKVFVLEVGNALRTIRAFSEGTMQADLDTAYLIVTNEQGEPLGSIQIAMSEIIAFLDGKTTVDEALARAELTGVFETFKE